MFRVLWPEAIRRIADLPELNVNNQAGYAILCLVARIRGKNTSPQLTVSRVVHALGYRYRPATAPAPYFKPARHSKPQAQALLLSPTAA